MLHALRPEAFLGSAMSTTAAVADYLRLEMGYEPAEQVRILFLGSGNRLIADEVLFRGTIDSAPIHARPIVHRALDLCATALIIVHNHPSGDASPSQADLQETHELRAALRAVDVVVHDHIIVARSGWTSLRARGLM
jgi:DNA repair protein RadC